MPLAQLTDEQLDELRVALRQEHLRRTSSERTCHLCRSAFYARADAMYCSSRCRVAACRRRARVEAEADPVYARPRPADYAPKTARESP